MYQSKRKTGFTGFLVAMKSIRGLFNDLVGQAEAPFKYLLTYKCSQDHLELFFGAIRSSGGFNNNPTSQLLIAAYKRLFLRSSIASGKGNCPKLEEVDILHICCHHHTAYWCSESCDLQQTFPRCVRHTHPPWYGSAIEVFWIIWAVLSFPSIIINLSWRISICYLTFLSVSCNSSVIQKWTNQSYFSLFSIILDLLNK